MKNLYRLLFICFAVLILPALFISGLCPAFAVSGAQFVRIDDNGTPAKGSQPCPPPEITHHRHHHHTVPEDPTPPAVRYTFYKELPEQKPFKRYYTEFADDRYYYTDMKTETTLEWGYPCYTWQLTSYPAPYTGYGRMPRYITPELVSAVQLPVTLKTKVSAYTKDKKKCEELLDSIREAWLDGDAAYLCQHLTRNAKLAIYLRDNYAYSISKGEYRALTSDAMSEITMESFEFTKKEWGRPAQVCALAACTFKDHSGQRHTENQSYILELQNGTWRIIAMGMGADTLRFSY